MLSNIENNRKNYQSQSIDNPMRNIQGYKKKQFGLISDFILETLVYSFLLCSTSSNTSSSNSTFSSDLLRSTSSISPVNTKSGIKSIMLLYLLCGFSVFYTITSTATTSVAADSGATIVSTNNGDQSFVSYEAVTPSPSPSSAIDCSSESTTCIVVADQQQQLLQFPQLLLFPSSHQVLVRSFGTNNNNDGSGDDGNVDTDDYDETFNQKKIILKQLLRQFNNMKLPQSQSVTILPFFSSKYFKTGLSNNNNKYLDHNYKPIKQLPLSALLWRLVHLDANQQQPQQQNMNNNDNYNNNSIHGEFINVQHLPPLLPSFINTLTTPIRKQRGNQLKIANRFGKREKLRMSNRFG